MMRKQIYIYRILGILLAVGLASFIAKDGLTEKIKQYLQTYRVNYTPEEVYVQLDKPYYIAGETIWLKAYLTDASTHQPISRSGVLYVDLMKEGNQPAQRLKLKVEHGVAKGNIDLPDSLEAGNYRLTAYTNWMRNFGEETFFNQSLRIWNSGEKEEAAQAGNVEMPEMTADAAVDLQFFPEGGDMVAGIPTEVAFKAIDEQGFGVPVKGFVMDSQGKKIIDFQSFHLGMGAFEFMPEAGVQYIARLVAADGSVQDYPMPEVSSNGFVLSVDEYQDENMIHIRIQAGDKQTGSDVVLTGISQNELVYAENIKLEEGQYETSIPKQELPTGIVRFTLSDPQGEPYAERLAFVRPENQLQLTISTNEPEFLSREQVRMTIEARDTEGNPVAAHLSLAVTDQEVVTPLKNGETIASYLLLTSDLKGYVEQPGYYFQSVNDSTKQALRYVMMTHGWRRFAWEDAVAGQYPDIQFAREQDLSIDGKLVNRKGDPVKGGEMILYVKDQHQTFIVEETDDQGNFSFDGFDFTDSVHLVIQGTTADGKRNVEVKIDEEEEDYVPSAPGWQVPMADHLLASANRTYVDVSAQRIEAEDAYQPSLRDMVLKEITVEDRVNIVEPMKLHDRADQVLRPQDLMMPPPSGNILESLQGRVAGLQVYRRGMNDFRATIRGYGEPLYLLDGIPISGGTVSALNPWDIERIEILKGPEAAIYGGRAAGGVIAFFTKRGGVEYEEVEPGPYIITHRAGGFSKTREFYAPKYTTGQTEQEKPDLRTTIYWEPDVQTGADGKAEVTFYTADRATTYRAVLEGITPDGLPGSHIYTFDVVKPEGDDVGR